jgi:SAM-dependent methyltransferase
VDETANPAAWVACVDATQAEPFYRDYKDRVRSLLAPRPEGLYLEVGAGAGTDALRLGARVIAVDRSMTMCREARARGQEPAIAADAEALPLRCETVDGCWADRTFQHLARPRRALEELTRVMKPGATLVVVDPDYGTQVMPFPDRELARRVLAFRAQHLLRNGTLAHEMARMFASAGLEHVSLEERRLTVEDPRSVANVMGLRTWARTASERGLMSASEAERWERLYDRVVADGTFRWSVSFYITTGRKPRA